MKKLLFIALSLIAVANVGCQRAKDPNPVDDKLQIVISSSIKGDAVAAKAEASKEKFATGDAVGIFVVPYKNSTTPGVLVGSGNYADNVAFVAQTDAAIFKPAANDKISFPNATTPVDVYAFGLYNAIYNDLGTNLTSGERTLDQDQSTAALVLKNDLMTAQKKNVSPALGNVPLQFHHRYAKVNIEFTAPTTYKGEAVKDVKAVYVVNTKLKAQVDLTDTAALPVLVMQDTLSIKAYKANNTGSAYVYEAIVMPQAVAAQKIVARVVLLVGDAKKEVSFNCLTTDEITYKKGSKSKLSLTFEGESMITLTGVTMIPWGDAGNNTAVAKQAVKQLFKVTGDPDKINSIASVRLTVDSRRYTAPTILKDDIISCSYLTDEGHYGTTITQAEFLDSNGAAVAPAFTGSWGIKGRPTEEGYNTITTTFNF